MRVLALTVGCAVLAVPLGGSLWAQGAQPEMPAQTSLDSLLSIRLSAASRYDQTAAEAPASVTVITWEDIERFGWRTLGEVLASATGFYTSDDRNYTYVGVRGIGRPMDYNNRVLLLLDGHPLNEGYYGMMPAGTDLGIDLRAVDRIEVVRGPGSALYGSNAMFAVIQITTRDVPRTVAGGMSVSAGSWGGRAVDADVRGMVGPVGVSVAGGRWSAQGEDLYFPEFAAVAEGVDGDATTYGAARLEWGGFRVQARMWERRKQIPTASWGTDFGDPDAWTKDVYAFMAVDWSTQVDPKRRVRLHGAIDRYVYDGSYPAEGVLYIDANDVLRLMLSGELIWDLRPDNRLVVGGDARQHPTASYQQAEDEEIVLESGHPYGTWSVFIQDEHHVTPTLVVVAGARWDHSDLGFHRVSPRGAVVWSARRGTTFKGLYGQAFRAPSPHELYFEDDGFLPSGGLKPEVVRTAEMVWEQRLSPATSAALSVFDSQVRRLIDTVEDEDGMARFENRESMSARGLELELVARGTAGMARLSYAYAMAEIAELAGVREASNSPAHVARAAAGGRLIGPLSATVQGRRESGRLTLHGTRTAAATLVDARAAVDLIVPGAAAWVGVRNLLDARHSVPGGFEHVQVAIPQPRRCIHVGLGYRF
jgi:outer membrane receptor for ferrienterochelin and colicins